MLLGFGFSCFALADIGRRSCGVGDLGFSEMFALLDLLCFGFKGLNTGCLFFGGEASGVLVVCVI